MHHQMAVLVSKCQPFCQGRWIVGDSKPLAFKPTKLTIGQPRSKLRACLHLAAGSLEGLMQRRDCSFLSCHQTSFFGQMLTTALPRQFDGCALQNPFKDQLKSQEVRCFSLRLRQAQGLLFCDTKRLLWSDAVQSPMTPAAS